MPVMQNLGHQWRALSPQLWRYGLTLAALWLGALLHLSLSLGLGSASGTALWPQNESFASLQFQLSSLPRLVMALLVGAALGLAGSLLQQLTNNRLVSPMTLGASSGAWLGLLLATLFWPLLAAQHGHWFALFGALATVCLVLLIAGRAGITGLPVILAGMAMNLLLGALAIAVLLLNQQQTRGLFIWGAGDLGQIDWLWVNWLAPKLLPAVLLFVLAPRVLLLLRLGSAAAQGRGLMLWPVLLGLFLAALWMSSVAITAVGLIGFIGLVAPNLARLIGARTARDELFYSTLLGMLLLVLSDALITSFIGPVSFLGLLAPHMASTLGARRIQQQLPLAALLGALLMLVADLIARNLIFPMQMPVGIVASIISGGYFILLLLSRRLS